MTDKGACWYDNNQQCVLRRHEREYELLSCYPGIWLPISESRAEKIIKARNLKCHPESVAMYYEIDEVGHSIWTIKTKYNGRITSSAITNNWDKACAEMKRLQEKVR